MTAQACILHNRVTDRAPVGIEGAALGEAAAVGFSRAHLHLSGVKAAPKTLWGPCIPIALSKAADAKSFRAVVAFSPDAAGRLIDGALGRPMRARDDLRAAGLSPGELGGLLYAADRLARAWMDRGGPSFVIRGVLTDEAQAEDYLGGLPEIEVRARLDLDGAHREVRLWCGAPAASTALPDRDLSAAFELEVRLSVCVGRSRLPVSEAAEMAVGDRVVLDSWNLPGASGGRPMPLLWSGAWKGYGRFTADDALQIGKETERNSSMIGDGESASRWTLNKGDEAEVREMSVDVRVEAGHVMMPVSEALGLVPGRVVRLDRPVGPDVRIFAGGKLLGRGTLVDVAGEMAVEITEIAGNGK